MNDLIEILQRDVDYQRRELAAAMKALSRRLALTAERLDAGDPKEVIVNGLGEVQSSGTMIDANCGRYEATLSALKTARQIAAQEEATA